MEVSALRINRWVTLGGLVLLAGALVWSGMARTVASRGDTASAEAFIRDLLVAQYTRPVGSDAEERLARAYGASNDEVSRELARVRAELRNHQRAMADMKAAYRDSKVRVRFRALHANGPEVYAVAEVLADWYWGYDGYPTETPTQVYNLHEFRLTHTGSQWQVVLDRHLASDPQTQVQVSPEPWSD